MCERCNLRKLVVVAERELNRTGDIPLAITQLQIIRSRMVKLGEDDKVLLDLAITMATFQPYLIEPNFMAQEIEGH